MTIKGLMAALLVILATPAASAQTPPEEGGSIGGVVTYYFNDNFGQKPDTGAKVALIAPPDGFSIPDTQTPFVIGKELRLMGGGPVLPLMAQTAVDGTGRFEIRGIAPGKYVVVIMSAHAKGKAKRDVMGKVFWKSIEIVPGQQTDASTDFGMTYL